MLQYRLADPDGSAPPKSMLESAAELRPDRFRHRLTRLGIHFLFVATFAMVGGSIRGFNLLLVLAGFLVGALLVQWRTSRRAVESLVVARQIPSETFADIPFTINYRVSNLSRWLSVWMIRVDDHLQLGDSELRSRFSCAIGAVGPLQNRSTHCKCMIARRGRYQLGPASLNTAFPFALITSTTSHQADAIENLYVYPRRLNLIPGWKRKISNRHGGNSTTVSRSGSQGDEFFGLREWQSGDSPRQIHWRTSARLDNLAVRQFEQERLFDLCILVDGFVPNGNPGNDEANAEIAISLAATIFTELSKSQANQVVVAIAGVESAAIGNGPLAGRRQRILQQLAQLETCDDPDIAGALQAAMRITSSRQDLVVISPRSLSTVVDDPNNGDSLREILTYWTRRKAFRWIDVSDQSTNQWIGQPLAIENADVGSSTSASVLQQTQVIAEARS